MLNWHCQFLDSNRNGHEWLTFLLLKIDNLSDYNGRTTTIGRNNMNPTKPKTPKPLPSVHLLGTGTSRFAGCGGLEAVQEIYDILDANIAAP
jgi:hypothetical protein